jgi:DNA-binding transcriptional LysR family regulator
MQRECLDDLRALVAVGRERSFTKAAGRLGVLAASAQPDIT